MQFPSWWFGRFFKVPVTIVLQGEICGDGIQGNKYHISGYDLFAFNLIYPDRKCKTAEIKEALAPFGIKTVPIVEEGKALPETIAEKD